MRRKPSRFWLLTLVGLATATSLSFAKSKPTPTPAFAVLENKDCGFSLRYPKNAKLEIQEGCSLKITPPSTKGQEWIEEAALTLEISDPQTDEVAEQRDYGEESTAPSLPEGSSSKRT